MKLITTNILTLSIIFSLYTSCDKDPDIITETVTVTDTVVVTQVDTVFISLTDTVTITEFMQDTATTFILVRHAETTGSGTNPNLSAAGMARADELARIMGSLSLDAVYSTNFNRTMQTASPVAADQGLTIQSYSGSNLNATADEILGNYPAGKILMVGHSNTTPDFINVLTGTNDYPQLPETEYDNLFIVTVLEKGRAEVLQLKYGG
jgi:broad specificity phosphatase PhoE